MDVLTKDLQILEIFVLMEYLFLNDFNKNSCNRHGFWKKLRQIKFKQIVFEILKFWN